MLPACAGMILIKDEWIDDEESVPRMRGDDPIVASLACSVMAERILNISQQYKETFTVDGELQLSTALGSRLNLF